MINHALGMCCQNNKAREKKVVALEKKIDEFDIKINCSPESDYKSHHKESEKVSGKLGERLPDIYMRKKINIENAPKVPTKYNFLNR